MAFSVFERMVAWRYLRAKRKEGFVSVISGFSLLGIALGVATLIIVMAVMNGFRLELMGRILGLNGHMGIYSIEGTSLTNYSDLINKTIRIDGIKSAIPIVEGQAMVSSDNSAFGAVVRGIRLTDFAKRDILSKNLKGGSLENFKGDNIIIGERMAQRMGVFAGDEITLISPKGQVTAFGTMPRMKAYKILATFSVGMYEYDLGFIFMPLNSAQKYFNLDNSVSNIEIMINNPDFVKEYVFKVATSLGSGYRIHDWQQVNSTFFNAIQVERNVMFLILTLIILVAAFNIISGLIMLVKDKGQDIAIMRTMGATRGMIMRIFFMSGAAIGFFGTLIGVVLGLLFCDNIENIRQFLQSLTGTELFSAEIYFLSKLPADVDMAEVFWVVIMSLGLSFGATIYPAWRAAKLDPVEALRYE